VIAGLASVASTFAPGPLAAQVPLAPVSGAGLTVTPAFEGWYQNADGTFSLSFGYFNRNAEEVIEIPLGPGNFIEPSGLDGVQPTRFETRRHWGVFVVTVPADFGDEKVRWTLVVRGKTFSIPGHLRPDWKIDALAGEAGTGNTPPVLVFDPNGPEARGPGGFVTGPLDATVGAPLEIAIWAHDDGKGGSSVVGARPDPPIDISWFKHQGPGDVVFGAPVAQIASEGGQAATTVTFGAPGEYVLRVSANDSSVSSAGHAQCCWTNAFVRVRVTS